MKNFFYKLWFEWLKITYKPTQFYYTNKINDNHKAHKSVGAGKSYVFSNKMKELEKLKDEIGLTDNRWFKINKYPALELKGWEIKFARERSKYKNLPKKEIIFILRKQKSDKV